MNEYAGSVAPAPPRASLFQPTAAMRAYYRGAAARAARELGLFEALAGAPGGMTIGALAARVGAGPRRLGALVDLLCLHGVLRREADRIAVGAESAPSRPESGAGWGALADVIRRDRPLDDDGIAGRAGEGLRRFHDALFAGGEAAAGDLSALVAAEGIGAVDLLDVGAGAGIYSAAFLRDRPSARVMLLDRPAVLDLARERLAGYHDRIDFVPGDALEVEWPAGVAAVLLANFLHLHSPAACERAIQRAASALAPGGALIIKDLRVDDDRSGPEEALIFAVHMALFSEGGSVYSVETIFEWLRRAGLVDLRFARLPSEPESFVAFGRKA